MCLTPVWSSVQLRIWGSPLRFGGSPTVWAFGFCLPWSPCVPPSDASSWSISSGSSLDRAGRRVAFIKGTAFPYIITSLCLPFLPQVPCRLVTSQERGQTGYAVLGLDPSVSPAHKVLFPHLPAALPSEAVRFHCRSWGWEWPQEESHDVAVFT